MSEGESQEFERDVAGVIAFPPFIFAIPLIASITADYLISKKRLPPAAQALAVGFFIAAGSVVRASFAEFKKADTAVDPFESSTRLVESGPYAHTRNPLYTGLACAYIGLALATRTRLPLAVLPAVLWIINAGVIDREERYLERKFGKPYRRYVQRVPRWL